MIKKILLLIYGLFSLFWLQAQSPGGVSGSTLWYRADAGVTVASGVSQWNNSAQSNYNLTQATAANRPAYNTTSNLINFNPSIRFDGVNDVVSAAGVPQNVTISGSNPYSTSQYVVYRQISGLNPIYQHSNGSGGTWNIGAQSDGQLLVSNRFISTTAPASNEVRLQGIDGTSNAASSYLNGALSSSTLTSTTSVSGTQPFWVGSGGTASFANVDMAEIVVYNTAQANRPRIESYLSLKYGITKSGNYQNSAASVVWDAAANTGYNNNIAGISRDDASGLNQKQSQSQNSGIQPVIGNGNIFDTNANNTNNFNADQSALIWGSDTGTTSFATSFVFGSLNARMTRIWKVQETGTVGTVKVALRATDLPANLTSPALVVSADAVFDGTDTRTALTLETLGGVQYYTATVDFTSGQFFTFAAYVAAPGGVVAGLKIWHKADAGVTAASNLVTAWTNQADGRQVINSGGTQRPTMVASGSLFNFNPYLDFTAATNALYDTGATPFTTDGDISYFVSLRPAATAANDGQIFGINDPSAPVGGAYDNHEWFNNSLFNTTSNVTTSYSPSMVGLEQSIATFTHNGAANIANGYRNLNVIINNATVTGPLGSGGYAFGADSGLAGGNNNSSLAQFSEHIAYNRVLSATEIQRVQSYLAVKTGVSLNQNYLASDGATTLWNTTTNAGYNNNIAGIARDDASALNQKQSASINSGIQPVIGNGNISDTNANNTNNFTADLSSLVWGSDTGSTSFATSFVFGGVNNRMARIWKVQETGTVGAVKVALPVSQLTLSPNTTTLSLIVSSDATFDGSDTRTAMTLETLGGVQYYTATVDFTSGQFFTFAAYVTAPGGVLGSSLWLKADEGTTNVSYFNVASGNRTASSNFSGLAPANSTLSSSSSWSAATATTGDFLTLDLGSVQTVYGVVTKGRGNFAQWVTGYAVSYSTDNVSYTSLGNFTGNADQNTEVVNLFTSAVTARYIRFTVNSYSSYPSMRADVVQSVNNVNTDNTAILLWNDQSGSNNNVFQGDTAGTPLYRNNAANLMNFNPVVSFDGTNDFMDATTFTINGTANTLFSAVKPNVVNISAQDVLSFGAVSSSIGGELRLNNATLEYSQNNPTFSPVTSGSVAVAQVPILFGSSMNNVANGTSVYQNNRAIATGTINQFPSAANLVSIGSRGVAGRTFYFNGLIPEVVAYNSLLTATQRQRVNSYLAIKYGITMDQTAATNYLASDGTTALWNAATNTGYNNNIAGIARDDASALNQKQSASVNTGIQPVIGNGNIFDTNANNTNNFTADLSALVWGSDTGSTSFATSFVFGTLNARMTRIWKVQETGTVGTVKVALRAADLPANLTSTALVVSADATFDGTDTRTAMTLETLGGVQYYTATVDFTSGQFFTFAALVTAPGGVTGEDLWLKADAGTGTSTDNTAITTWADQSGNANNVSQATAVNRPVYRNNSANLMNFNPTVSFDGTNDFMDATTFTINGTANTLFSAVKPNVVNLSAQDVLSFGALGLQVGGELRLNNATLEYSQNNTTFSPVTSGSVAVAQVPLLFGSSMSNTASGASVYQNNLAVATGAINQFPSAANLVSIGSRTLSSRAFYFNGLIPEVVTYNSLLTAAQRQRVNSYLAIKYGVTLDQSTVLNFNNGDFNTNNFNYWLVSGNVTAVSGNAAFNGSDTTPNGVISQSISTVNGQSYTVGGDVRRIGAGAGTPRVRLDVIDNSTSVVIATQNITASSGTATPFTPLAFTGNGNSFTIRFTDTSTATISLDIVLDNITLTPNASATGMNYLNSASGVIWDAAANTGYNNNIAGIARDDASALNQKQSQSVNSGIQPVIANGNIFDTNANNTNNFTADLSALVWGSDTGSTSFATSFAFGSVNNRMARIWRVQETGTVGTVKVALPVSQLALSANTTALALVVSTDAVFDGTDTRTAMTLETLGGVQYYTATVDFTSGQFFTFAALVTAPGGVITGLRQWLKADAGTSTTTAGAGVATWSDQSGNGFDALQSSAALAPLYRTAAFANKYNFNPYLDYSGGKGSYNAGASAAIFSSNNDNASIFVMSQGYTTGGSGIGSPWAVGFNTSGTTYLDQGKFGFPNSSTAMAWGRAAGSLLVTSSGIDDQNTANQIYVVDWNGATATTKSIRARQNGRILNSAANTNPLTIGTNTTNQFGISDGGNGSIVGDNNMGTFFTSEMIVYNTQLTELEMTRVSSYLAIKYGKTLSRDNSGNGTAGETITGSILEGDYVASDGTTRIWNSDAAYQNNIAGIGRDDLSALHQKQSQSVNTGSQVVMALGTAAASNQANAGTIPTDKQFLIWGDDNGSLNTQVSTGNNTYTYRFTRVWKTQNTGTFAENMTVYYPVAAFGNASASTVALLYGTTAASLSNGAASAIAQSGTTTINGVSHYAFTVPSAQVANMQFFSFAGTQTSPGGVTGTTTWFKADAGVTLNGSNVSALANQSANTNLTQLAQPTASRQPAFTVNSWNFNPGITYDGTSDILENTFPSMLNVLNATNNEVFGALSVTGGATAKVYFQVSDNGSFTNRLSLENTITQYPTNVSSIANTGLSQTSDLPSIINFASGSGSMSYAINGNAAVSAAFSGSITAGTTPRYKLGAFNDTGSYSHFAAGNINEVTTYNRTLTTTERQRVQSYLGLKYGRTIAHNYIASDGTAITWNTTTNAGYNNNIAGIGRDDLTALYQKQSQSVNTGSQVVMALGTVAATNQANANTIPTDRQFFIWGDDNGSLSTFVSTGNTTYPSRFTRVWRAQNTGTFAQNMTVYYPVSAFGTSLASSVGLLYGSSAASLSNGSASVIPQSGTTTINGVSYYAFTVPSAQVANMQFFSFTGATVCYKPAVTVGTTLDAKHGITALSRAGTAGDNWPMVRKGAWTVLEAKTKGFVINRLTAAQIAAIPPANLVEGMMVYDTTNNCMKVYTSTDGGTTFNWQCIATQTCPD